MVNYNLGKIYKIEATNGEEGDIYIGSTTEKLLSTRMAKHRGSYKQWKAGKRRKTMSFDLFEKYGIENCKIVLLEYVVANFNDELLAREAFYIKLCKCINKVIPLRTLEEYRIDNKERKNTNSKQYYEENKEKINERRRLRKQQLKTSER